MMKDKKGFTLMELLAVIAILGVLVVIVMINVLRIYRNAKEDAFITQVQSIYKAAEERYMSDSLLEGRADVCYDNETNPFDLNGQEVGYFLKFNEEGKIIYIVTKDNDYKIIAGNTENKENIRQDEMGTSRSDAKYKSSVLEEDIVLPKCFIMDLPSIVFGEESDGAYPTRGFLSKDKKLYKEDGESVLEKLDQMPKKKGHKFLGYYIPGTEDAIIDENGNVVNENVGKLDGPITLEAKWEEIEYYIEFNGNGNTSGEMENMTVMYDTEIPFTLNQYKKTGSIFKGWARSSEASEAEFSDGYIGINLVGAGETLTLYAVWEECTNRTYSDGITDVCQKCPDGSICTGGVIEKTCEAGTYNDGSTNTCIQCPAGHSCTGGANNELCAANTYAEAGSQSCTDCPKGYVVAKGAGTAQTSCYIAVPDGKTLTAKNGTAFTNCAAGTYKKAHNVNYGSSDTACTDCAANTWSAAQAAACTDCPKGYVVAKGAGTAQNKCYIAVGAGKYLKAAKGTEVENCAAGTYKAAHNVAYGSGDSCSNCASGQWSTAGSSSCTTIAINSSTVACNVTNTSNTAGKSMVYTGNCKFLDDGNGNWRIKFLTSGTLVLTRSVTIDAFLVGGGASGCSWGGAGGGSGYTFTQKNKTLSVSSYQIVIGAGGAGVSYDGGGSPKAGGASTAFGLTANGGGAPGCKGPGGNGGSGGGGGGGGAGGSNGGNGGGGNGYAASRGQGTTTREFGESTGDLYAGGGGGGNSASGGRAGGAGGGGTGGYWSNGGSGTANTGGGGGGAGATGDYYSGAGGTGIVIIRNKR